MFALQLPIPTYFNRLEDFGARGDGTTDDSSSIQNAINAGKPILLLPKSYVAKSQISLPSGCNIIGQGDASVIDFQSNAYALLANGTSNITLQNFKLNGNRSTYTSTGNNGIFIDWRTTAGSNVLIDNVTIPSFAGAGIMALASSGTPSSGLTISNCRTSDIGAWAVIAQDYISIVKIISNTIGTCGLLVADTPGITASRSGSGVVVSNNICTGSLSALGTSCHAISIDTSTDVTCSGNVCRNWAGFGIEAGIVTTGSFTGNTCDGINNAGIAITGRQSPVSLSTNLTIAGNTINNCVYGIYSVIASGSGTVFHSDITISGNLITLSQSRGVYLNLINRLNFSGNIISTSALSGLWTDNCTRGYVSSNTICDNNTANNAIEGGSHFAKTILVPALDVFNGSNLVEGNGIQQVF